VRHWRLGDRTVRWRPVSSSRGPGGCDSELTLARISTLPLGSRDSLGRFRIDVFREPHDENTWICRRDSRLRRPYSDLIGLTDGDIPYMVPEVVLLFKAKHDLPKDRQDLNEALKRMDERSIRWLADAIAIVHPDHEWLALLPSPC
jgi:hypothetical protein